MSVTIQIKRGTEAQILAGTLALGELAFATDTKEVITYDGVSKQYVGRALYDVLTNRPTAAMKGRLFLASDTGLLYLDTGSAWVNGAAGVQGSQGTQGFQGTQGNQGASVTGSQGNQGFQGYQGNQGLTGPVNTSSVPVPNIVPLTDALSTLDSWITPLVIDINTDQLDVDYIPINYTPVAEPGSLTSGQLGAHLKGIDNVLGVVLAKMAAHGW